MTTLCQGRSKSDTQSFGSNPRRYGLPPFALAVVHGGPGAAGEMAPVARELSMIQGVLEPMQTAGTLDGQVEELKVLLEKNASPPMTLIGFSWGAWLSFILAARYPDLVKRLVLVASGPFQERYARQILPIRLSRLGEAERREVESILRALEGPAGSCGDRGFSRLGEIFSSCDSFDPIVGLNYRDTGRCLVPGTDLSIGLERGRASPQNWRAAGDGPENKLPGCCHSRRLGSASG